MIMNYEIRRGAYYDSVVLMQLQKGLAGLPGVDDAGVVMATPANLELLAATDLLPDGVDAKPDDLLIVVRADTDEAAQAAIGQVDELLKRKRGGVAQSFRPHSLTAAADALPEAGWVLVSVPGRYAAGVAREALDLGKHVFLYSDNVALEDEVELKQKGREKGLLVMGPDCGTAIINGVGLGFANRVRRGKIGIAAASGTGLQAVSAEVHNLGGGVSHAIGTGGRDLKTAVGAITMRQGLSFLADDPDTEIIVLISKPPSPQAATRLLVAAQNGGKPVVVNLIGYPSPARQLGNLHFAAGLSDTAELAVKLSRAPGPKVVELHRPFSGYVRGLFSGGTLAYEVLLGLQSILTPLYSNIPIRPEQALADVMESQAHTILDLGEDAFTQGRLHPMMDNDLRVRRLRQEIADPETGMILLDVVLGEGSHPDPVSELAPAIAEAKQAGKKVVAVVVGTDEDPQELIGQIEALIAAGATVFATTTEMLDYVYNRVRPSAGDLFTAVEKTAFQGKLAAINVGVESFYDSLKAQGAEAIQVEWRPPAGGNEKLMAILAKMKGR